MKTIFLTSLTFAFVLLCSSFKSNDPKDPILDFISNDYLRSSNSDALKSIMKTNFGDLFDDVNKIDIHANQQGIYYYAVYGSKNNNLVIELFKTTPKNIANETFPSLKTNKNSSAIDPYCYWQIQQNRCGYEPDFISIRCGLVSKGCQSF